MNYLRGHQTVLAETIADVFSVTQPIKSSSTPVDIACTIKLMTKTLADEVYEAVGGKAAFLGPVVWECHGEKT